MARTMIIALVLSAGSACTDMPEQSDETPLVSAEICNSDFDEDWDGLKGCQDPDCAMSQPCVQAVLDEMAARVRYLRHLKDSPTVLRPELPSICALPE